MRDSSSYGALEEAIEAAIEAARGALKFGFSAAVFLPGAQGGWTSVPIRGLTIPSMSRRSRNG